MRASIRPGAIQTAWLEEGHGVGLAEYLNRFRKNPFEVEHIWANHPERHTDEFDNPYDFAEKRNRFGDLLLLPKDFNASYGDKPYEDKLEHYFGQNVLAKSLHPKAYQHNPTFLALIERTGLPFQPIPGPFTSASIDQRQDLYQRICEYVWSPTALGLDGGTAPGRSRDYYLSFGQGEHRNWDDARTYGFVSAGGGRWYSQPLQLLKPGDRVFAYAPGHGYVGVGIVQDTAKPASQLDVTGKDGARGWLRQQPLHAPNMWEREHDPDRAEQAVPVTWLATRDLDQAKWQPGWFANQTTACRLRNPELVEELTTAFGIET